MIFLFDIDFSIQENFVELYNGAGDGNRTHAASLEGWNSTIELHPHAHEMNVIICFFHVQDLKEIKNLHYSLFFSQYKNCE